MADTSSFSASISHLPELVDALATDQQILVTRLFQIVTSQGQIDPPDTMKAWIKETFGSLAAALQQRVVRVTNRWTFEGAAFNPLRARRPGSGFHPQARAVPPAELRERIERSSGDD